LRYCIVGRNKLFKKSMVAISNYLYDERGNVKDEEFFFTIFPRPEINDYALSKKVERQ
jgi:hypothetical protein